MCVQFIDIFVWNSRIPHVHICNKQITCWLCSIHCCFFMCIKNRKPNQYKYVHYMDKKTWFCRYNIGLYNFIHLVIQLVQIDPLKRVTSTNGNAIIHNVLILNSFVMAQMIVPITQTKVQFVHIIHQVCNNISFPIFFVMKVNKV